MKPDDSNLTVKEYIKYFADENATRFLQELISKNGELKVELDKLQKELEEFGDLQYAVDDLSSKNWSLEIQIEELEEEIQTLNNDILRMKTEK